MKRIFSALLLAALVISLAVPAFADDTAVIPAGKYSFLAVLTMPENPGSFNQAITFTQVNGDWNELNTLYGIGLTRDSSYRYTLAYDVNGSNGWNGVYDFSNASWYKDWRRDIEVVSNTTVSTQFYEWFMANARPLTCDGSTCPANDANADDVCDDCGMTLSLRATAPEYPLPLPTVPGAYKHSVLSKASSGRYDYSVIVSNVPISAHGERGTAYIAYFDDMATVYRYSSSNGNDWELNVDGATGTSFTIGADGYLELQKSTFTWYDAAGNPFFPEPLWKEMGELTQGEMGQALLETLGTMRTLMVCGIGCLAFLVVLSLFGKRSLIFRG